MSPHGAIAYPHGFWVAPGREDVNAPTGQASDLTAVSVAGALGFELLRNRGDLVRRHRRHGLHDAGRLEAALAGLPDAQAPVDRRTHGARPARFGDEERVGEFEVRATSGDIEPVEPDEIDADIDRLVVGCLSVLELGDEEA